MKKKWRQKLAILLVSMMTLQMTNVSASDFIEDQLLIEENADYILSEDAITEEADLVLSEDAITEEADLVLSEDAMTEETDIILSDDIDSDESDWNPDEEMTEEADAPETEESLFSEEMDFLLINDIANPEQENSDEDLENPGEDPENPGEDPENPGEDPENPGEDPENPEEPKYQLLTVNQETISTIAEGSPEVLIFFDGTDSSAKEMITALMDSDLSGIRILAAECGGMTARNVKAFANQTKTEGIIWCYNASDTLAEYDGDGSLPLVLFVDGENNIAERISGNTDLISKTKEVLGIQIPQLSYTITYKLNGGTNSGKNPKTYKKSSDTILFKKPTQKGYTFAGWYKNAAFTEKRAKIAFGSTGNVTVYAKWTPNKYTIKYNANGGTGTMKNQAGCTYNKKFRFSANVFQRTNYIFIGWNTRKDGKGTSYKNKAEAKNLTAKNGAVINLYAQWKRRTYSIAFKANGGTGKMASLSCKAGNAYKLTKNKFNRKGYTFEGWNTKASGKGKSYKNLQSVKNLTNKDNGTVTLYAQWKRIKYNLSYELNGGTLSSPNPSSYYVNTNTFTLKKPTKSEHVFVGWYSDSALTKKVTSIKKGSTGNKKLYAKWRKIAYTVVLNANGGTGVPMGGTCEINTTYYLPLSDYVQEGYVCYGWNSKADGSGTSYSFFGDFENLSNKDGDVVTLYAMWEKKTEKFMQLERDVVKLVNQVRAENGLPALKTNSTLTGIAEQRAFETVVYWDHTRPDGRSCFSIYAGYDCMTKGENIARGVSRSSAESVMSLWLDSPPHRANILSSDFDSIGVGVFYYNGTYYWVQNFSGSASSW